MHAAYGQIVIEFNYVEHRDKTTTELRKVKRG